jgi:hypothetical protein
MTMKRFILALSTIAVIGAGAPGLADASDIGHSRKFGLGGMLGQPTAVTIKYHFSPKHALTAAFGVGWYYGNNLHAHVDYGYHFDLTRQPTFDLRMYVGGGIKFFYFYHHDYHPYWDKDWRNNDYHRTGLGIRGPVGIAFNINKVPLEVFLEIVPGFAFLPWLDFFVDGAIGLRYYF